MTLLHQLLTAIASGADPGPFALVRREGEDGLQVFTGAVQTVARLAEIPLPAGRPGPRTLALVPYRQIAERGFACVDDNAPLECLAVSAHDRVPLDAALRALPAVPVRSTGGGFDLSDDEYADVVDRVLRDEIGRGEGANFVIHRTFHASLVAQPVTAALSALRRLLLGERGAYWTFLVHTGARTLIGATPERHVSVEDGLAMMNPISGTFRHAQGSAHRDGLLRFLADRKEIDELYMVLDEELKMMATVAEHGGQVVGPYLKEMSRLSHTEYLLAGRSSMDARDVLRVTMFAPTVTGSPIENACRVIARHERRGRGYYAGVLALLGHDESGRQTLDAPILIRTAEISPSGELRVPVGATLVRHSTAEGEVAETHTKAAAVLAALGLGDAAAAQVTRACPAVASHTVPSHTVQSPAVPSPAVPSQGVPTTAQPASDGVEARLADDPAVTAALAARNGHLARFWLEQRMPGAAVVPDLAGRRVVIVDGEDTFTAMLAHQLRALGLTVTVRPWRQARTPTVADLVVVGPGPGDPTSTTDPKMSTMRLVVADLLERGRPLLAVCLGHQLLSGLLGLRLHRRDAPYQGLQRQIDLFGKPQKVGFYSTFTAVADTDAADTPYGPVRLSREATDGAVHALRGRSFAGLQFHPESVLSQDGMAVLGDLLPDLLRTTSPASTRG